jgi:hypothetical protein
VMMAVVMTVRVVVAAVHGRYLAPEGPPGPGAYYGIVAPELDR